MKAIVFFSRCELVHLYGKLSKQLSQSHKVIHLAYSKLELDILEKQYDVKNVISFEKNIKNIYENKSYLEIDIQEIDNILIEQSGGRFNLNGALQYDRSFQYLNYLTNLQLSQIYYKFWSDFFKNHEVDYIIHEPTTLFFNHIAAVICKLNDAKYITFIQVYGESDYNFAIVEGDHGGFSEMNNINYNKNEFDLNRIKVFLNKFRLDSKTFFNINKKNKKNLLQKFLFSFNSTVKIFLKYFNSRIKLKTKKYSILDHLELFHLKSIKLVQEVLNHYYYYYGLNYDEPLSAKDELYYYYPLHLEPEAVVLYWGDGLYKNQVKLIENIAAQLPPNNFLYVKDHPHAGSYRDYRDYKRIQLIPNVKLIQPKKEGKKIILNSVGVITINGTSGFEALLLNKQVYTFGNCFFNKCQRVNHIKNIKDLRSILYLNKDIIYKDDDELYNFINLYLNYVQSGFTSYFTNRIKMMGINEIDNTKLVAKGLQDYFNKF
ncbi:hypothetical protein [Polaribacter vadi]|uniref:capsular polysaccharide export protein, LipB/KpsS family n=1 Tax=Polaribacter vadi TaxID=1774273 RepID=UPI0030EF0052|tara:strand:+ start:12859 stop:14322 length:1464 start_codon:yes stop_codon:yes gene_type:complete